MRSITAIVAAIAFGVSVTSAGNVINEHSGYYQEDVHYSILNLDGNDYAVLILEGSDSAHTWQFEAYDSDTEVEGYINYIRIQPTDAVGPIKLSILGSTGHTYGAADVKEIDLKTNADDTSEIVDINISGNLAADGDVSCDSVTGDITIGGNTYNTLDLGDVDSSSTITITKDLEGTLSANTLGNVLIYGDAGPIAVPGDIIIAQNYAGTINVDPRILRQNPDRDNGNAGQSRGRDLHPLPLQPRQQPGKRIDPYHGRRHQ